MRFLLCFLFVFLRLCAGQQAQPACVQQCDSASTKCSAVDITCLCNDNTWVSDVSCCIIQSCSSSDQSLAFEYYNTYCSSIGKSSSLFSSSDCQNPSSSSSSAASSTSTSTSSAATSTSASSTTTSSGSSSTSSSPATSQTGGTQVNSSSKGIGAGAIAGIVVGAVLFIAAIGALFFICGRRSRKSNAPTKAQGPAEDKQTHPLTELGHGDKKQLYERNHATELGSDQLLYGHRPVELDSRHGYGGPERAELPPYHDFQRSELP